ncbi:MAG: SDR family oxidoreductase [SAR324 cluster bacterium]|jgi:NAD(P)-dependent dehydrogenase (short-subunit alcohol dehydrogenase family)|nr:SDR family oxidoreductase [SAR324 cluster bacterium]
MDLGLRDKIVLVTGGAKGIGAATVKAFLAEDCKVVIVDRDTEAGPVLAKSSGSKARFVEADLTNLKSCKQAVEQTVSWFGGLDVLVNNAGFNDGLGLETSPEDFMTSVQNNLLHVYAMTHYSLPQLRKGPGSILNLGSKVSVTGQGKTSAYAAAKGAISALTREWAVALAPEKVRVNCVIPAECITDQYEQFFQTQTNPEAAKKAIADIVPFEQRLTTPEEIAQTIVFLASDRSSHTTGQLVFVDGGYTHFDRAVGHDHNKW